MPLTAPSPLCDVDGGSTTNGVDVTPGATVRIDLHDKAGVKTWSIACTSTDDLLDARAVTESLEIDPVSMRAMLIAPGEASALIFTSTVNGGRDGNGQLDPTLTTTFGIYTLTHHNALRVGAFDETTEGNAASGWVAKFNALARLVGA